MIGFRFSVDDLAQTRFAISPMWELITGLRILRDPGRAPQHLPWVTDTLPIAAELELEGALALTPAEGYMPDFITPPPTDPLARFEDELERVRGTAPAQVRNDIALLRADGRGSPVLDRFEKNPRREVDRMCDSLALLW